MEKERERKHRKGLSHLLTHERELKGMSLSGERAFQAEETKLQRCEEGCVPPWLGQGEQGELFNVCEVCDGWRWGHSKDLGFYSE